MPVTDPKGNQFKTEKQMAKAWGIPYNMYKASIERGATLAEALQAPMSQQSRLGIRLTDLIRQCLKTRNQWSTIAQMAEVDSRIKEWKHSSVIGALNRMKGIIKIGDSRSRCYALQIEGKARLPDLVGLGRDMGHSRVIVDPKPEIQVYLRGKYHDMQVSRIS